jgi:chromosomal replication initiator protein
MNPFWRHCLVSFEKELPPQQFRTWIKPLKCSVEADSVTLTAPNRFVQQWIRDKFVRRVEELALEHFKHPVELKLLLADKESADRTVPPPPDKPVPAAQGGRLDVSRLNPGFTFATS